MITSEDMEKEDVNPHSLSRPRSGSKRPPKGSVARVGEFERIKTSDFDTKTREEKKDIS